MDYSFEGLECLRIQQLDVHDMGETILCGSDDCDICVCTARGMNAVFLNSSSR